MKKTKNKMTMVEPNSLAESPNKAIVKKKNRNNKKKKNKAFKNMNGNIGTLVSDATVVVAPAISMEGKKMKKKKKNKNLEHLNKSTCGPQTDVSMKDASTVPKKDMDISDANDSADVLGNKNIEDLDKNIHLPVANVSVSETVAISKNGVKDLKENVEIPMDDKEGINDSSEISKKDIDKKAENSMIDIPVNCESTISKKKKKKKKEQEKQQPVVEGEAVMKDIEEIKDNSETPMKDVDEKEEHSQIDVSVTSTSTISKKKKKRKKKKKKKEQEPVTEGEVLMKDTEEINDNAKTPMKDIEDIDEKAENSGIDMSVTSISTISKKKKQQQQQQQQPVTEVTLDSSVVTTDVTAELPSISTNNPKVDGDPGEPDTDGKKKKNKKKKRKISEVESTTTDISCDVNDEISEAQSTTTGTSSNVNIASQIARKESEAKKKTSKGFTRNLEEEGRTIFVGNVNIKTKRRDLARIFSKYGKVETVRIRCAAVADPKKSKKETVITGNYNSLRTSVNAYVRFKTKDMMIAALEANGVELKGKHLRVDKALSTEDQSIRHSVFVGNLPIEAEEEALRSEFADCGEIHSVRLIRDRDFASCKGFGYVNFMSPDSVEFALQLNNKIFMHRQLRVQRCVNKSKNKKKEKMSKNKPGKKGVGFVNLQKARTEKNKPKADGDFSGMKMVETNKFKKMKKAKGKLSKEDKKKLAVSCKLTGVKPKFEKTT